MGCSTTGQYFDPELDDQTYLNNLQKKLEIEVNATRVRLVEQAKLTEMIAKEFVSAQIKENLFIVGDEMKKLRNVMFTCKGNVGISRH